MNDPVGAIAQAAARRLTPEYGPRLQSEVEAALYARDAERRPDQYLDPVTLGSLIVSTATLAWTIYNDLRKKAPEPRQMSQPGRCESSSRGIPTPRRTATRLPK